MNDERMPNGGQDVPFHFRPNAVADFQNMVNDN